MSVLNKDLTTSVKLRFRESVNKLKENLGRRGIPHLLTPPPIDPEIFTGREEDLQAIHDHFLEREKTGSILLLVNGEGGIGKTSVASRYFHTHGEKYQHVAWVFIGDSIVSSLLSVADALLLRFPQEYTQEQRYQAFLKWIWALKTPILLVLDNANKHDDLSEQYRELRKSPTLHILITSRVTSLSNIPIHSIKAFDDDEAYKLFTRYYADVQQEEKELLYAIFQAVGYNTLVIELLAKNLKKLNRNKKRYGVEDLLVDLQNRNLLSLSKSRKITSDYVLEEQAPEAIIGGMYEILHLTGKQKKLLAIFSVLPAEVISFARLESMIPDIGELDDDLEALINEGWLEEDKASFKINPVIQEVVRKKHKQLFNDCKSLISGLKNLLAYESGIGHFAKVSYEEAAIYTRYGENLIRTLNQNSYAEADLCINLGVYYSATGNLYKGLELFEKCKDFCEQTQDKKTNQVRTLLGIAFQYLGNTYLALGQLQNALNYFKNQNSIWLTQYEENPENIDFKNGLAISYEKLGEIQSNLGNLEKALGYFEEYMRLETELLDSYSDNFRCYYVLAISYEKLGEIHSIFGNFEKALCYFEEYTRLGQELYDSYSENVGFKNGLSISYSKLAIIHSKMNNKEIATKYFAKCKLMWEELSRDFPAYSEFKSNLEWVNNQM